MKNCYNYAIYGFGGAGRSLCASLMAISGTNVAVFSRKPNASQLDFAKKLKITLFAEEEEFSKYLASVQVLFIAVTDDSVEQVASCLQQMTSLPPIVAHLSGALSCEALQEISKCVSTAQFHPLASLDGHSKIPAGCLVVINSESANAFAALTNLAESFGCGVARLKTGDQSLYHAAAALTGNLSLGLLSMSQKLFELCGIERVKARLALAQLLKSAAAAIEQEELPLALTGPLARGDVQTVAKHLEALRSALVPEEILATYVALSVELLEQITLPHETHAKIHSALERLKEARHVGR